MLFRVSNRMSSRLSACLYLALLPATVLGQVSEDILKRVAALEMQNQELIALIGQQQNEIENLRNKVAHVQEKTTVQSETISELQDLAMDEPLSEFQHASDSRIHVSGHAGVIFRAGEANTNFPNEEFRVDEARLMVEAQVHEGIYLVSQLELFDRENDNPNVELGELFIEFEDLLDNQVLSVRAGRLQIPFGEEYQNRYVMENPLISHSVSDFWGLDEGVEAFGQLGGVSYIAGIMNGGHDYLRDYSSSKSLVARLTIDPTANVHFSGSVMRTGDIDIENEGLTELWFGNAFFRSIGSGATTAFDVNLAQVDASFSWNNGKMVTAYGKAWYDDNDPIRDNTRDIEFWQVGVQQALSESLFAAVRYSGTDADKGYPVSGMAQRGKYFFGPFMTESIRRLSLGLSYWLYPDLVLKLDLTKEDATLLGGAKRKDTDMFAAEIGARF